MNKANKATRDRACSACAKELRVPETYYCQYCGAVCCGKHIYQRVDEANASITRYAPRMCGKCYKKRYPGEAI
jgi:hypothetical protein